METFLPTEKNTQSCIAKNHIQNQKKKIIIFCLIKAFSKKSERSKKKHNMRYKRALNERMVLLTCFFVVHEKDQRKFPNTTTKTDIQITK